jgi:hypothetical protein
MEGTGFCGFSGQGLAAFTRLSVYDKRKDDKKKNIAKRGK